MMANKSIQCKRRWKHATVHTSVLHGGVQLQFSKTGMRRINSQSSVATSDLRWEENLSSFIGFKGNSLNIRGLPVAFGEFEGIRYSKTSFLLGTSYQKHLTEINSTLWLFNGLLDSCLRKRQRKASKNQFNQGDRKKLLLKYQTEYHWTCYFQTSGTTWNMAVKKGLCSAFKHVDNLKGFLNIKVQSRSQPSARHNIKLVLNVRYEARGFP